MNLFRDEKLLYKGLTSNLSKPVITSLFHKDFIGLNDFVALYTIYDGVDFIREAKMYRSQFYTISKGELDLIDVSFFLKWKDIISEKQCDSDVSTAYKSFMNTHIPFADDGCGNTIWLDTDTGLIKRLDHEEEFGAETEERRVGKECRSRWSPYH